MISRSKEHSSSDPHVIEAAVLYLKGWIADVGLETLTAMALHSCVELPVLLQQRPD